MVRLFGCDEPIPWPCAAARSARNAKSVLPVSRGASGKSPAYRPGGRWRRNTRHAHSGDWFASHGGDLQLNRNMGQKMVYCANQLRSPGQTMSQHLSDVLNACERMGKLNVRGEELRARLSQASPEALRKALYRQQRAGRVVRLSRGSDHWLIVPLQYAAAGSPPLEAWLDPYLRKTLGTPYYVGLLSAAETYGASPYAVMVTQVMVENKRRPVAVGRHKLVFHTCSRIEAMPTRWHESADGRFKVSTPELTVLDLIQRENVLGGMSRVREVLRALWSHCTPQGLTQALDAVHSVPVAQRLGALLMLDEQTALVAPLSDWLQEKPTRLIALEGSLPRGNERTDNIHADFKVWMPPQQGANT
ncbi:hypothetical protein D8B34_20030 [Verminephrobacter eiseniae]|nr:hypothetical protein [Verminephrobacter eiseniae]MCW5295049.1 hypothetical protein [Verminephrobacter eiseniae]MCW8186058.1 hypothetical protein [Verminephrobacter eiseniae]MCW8224902.1 hypothetical protein [Verminephrobacter eiseniae]MCW8235952.1 hypothetical protein [Verminephrobacter eiseniae]